jgi:hypothetical protein
MRKGCAAPPYTSQASLPSAQQVTEPIAWLYYSAPPQNGTQYIGHRTPFSIRGN